MAGSNVTPAPAPEISLVEAVWRYRQMAILIVLACLFTALGATQLLFGSVQATARFAVSDPNATTSSRMGVTSGAGFATYTAQRAAFAESAPVLRRAAEIVRGQGGPKYSLEAMRGSVQTTTMTDGGVVKVQAAGSSMQVAAAKANAVVEAYQELTAQVINSKRDNQLKNIKNAQQRIVTQLADATGKEADALALNLTRLQTQEANLLVEAANAADGVQFIDQADPSASAPTKLPRNGAIGLAVGVLIAMVASFLRASAPSALTGTLAPGAGAAAGAANGAVAPVASAASVAPAGSSGSAGRYGGRDAVSDVGGSRDVGTTAGSRGTSRRSGPGAKSTTTKSGTAKSGAGKRAAGKGQSERGGSAERVPSAERGGSAHEPAAAVPRRSRGRRGDAAGGEVPAAAEPVRADGLPGGLESLGLPVDAADDGDAQVWPRDGGRTRHVGRGVEAMTGKPSDSTPGHGGLPVNRRGAGDEPPVETPADDLWSSSRSDASPLSGGWTERTDWSDRTERADRTERDRTERGGDKADRGEATDWSDWSERRDRGGRLTPSADELLDRPTERDLPVVPALDDEASTAGPPRAPDLLNYRDDL